MSLHNTEVRLPCKGVKKVKYDSSNKLPVWVSNNLRNDSTDPSTTVRLPSFNSGRRISVQANLRAIRGWYGRPVQRKPRHEVIALSQYMSIIRFLWYIANRIGWPVEHGRSFSTTHKSSSVCCDEILYVVVLLLLERLRVYLFYWISCFLDSKVFMSRQKGRFNKHFRCICCSL